MFMTRATVLASGLCAILVACGGSEVADDSAVGSAGIGGRLDRNENLKFNYNLALRINQLSVDLDRRVIHQHTSVATRPCWAAVPVKASLDIARTGTSEPQSRVRVTEQTRTAYLAEATISGLDKLCERIDDACGVATFSANLRNNTQEFNTEIRTTKYTQLNSDGSRGPVLVCKQRESRGGPEHHVVVAPPTEGEWTPPRGGGDGSGGGSGGDGSGGGKGDQKGGPDVNANWIVESHGFVCAAHGGSLYTQEILREEEPSDMDCTAD